jgi:hypothetical protein
VSSQVNGLLTLAAVIAVGCLGGYSLHAWSTGEETPATPPPVLTGSPYVDDLRHLSWLLREKWSWLEMRESQGLDLEVLESEAIALCTAEPGERAFLRALTRYVSGLSDGHAHVELDGVDLREERRWPFSLIEVEEGVMVDGIGPAIFMSKALKRGDLVLAIDDEPIEEVIRAREDLVFASTPGARRRAAIFALTEWSSQESMRVRALPMGETEPVTVEVPCLAPSEPVPRYAWRLFSEKYEDIDTETAYFCVGTFAPLDAGFKAADPEARHRILADRYDGYARVFEGIGSRDALVLDLRGNGGGTDLLGQALALHLMKPGFRYLRLASRRGGRWRKTGWQTPEVGRGTPRFDGRVVCLIDEQCFSVTDNFASSLRDERLDVLFVGQPTGGGSGAPRTFTLPSTKARVRFCTMRVHAPDGTYVEGNGVQPDVLIRSSRAQMLAGEDAVLEAGLASLRD